MTPKNPNVVWKPLPGSQTSFLRAPFQEVLFHGTRGPGKTTALLMSFARYVGQGHGDSWRGILFRRTYKQLDDVITKSQQWFRRIFKGILFNKNEMAWRWPGGECLLLRYLQSPSDYWNYHGHEYPWIGWEELTNWPTEECYLSMMACCRSSKTNMPRMIRATTNPYGVGHQWVKERFKLDVDWDKTILIEKQGKIVRGSFYGNLGENKHLLEADPEYRERLVSAITNEAMAKAWIEGSWNIVVGGMFTDVFDPKQHVVSMGIVPESWFINRSFDWGSSAPFSVGWWAESDGSPYIDKESGEPVETVRGDLFRIGEWYGCGKKRNEGLALLASEVTKGIREWENNRGLLERVRNGPADTNIFVTENGHSIARDMMRPVKLSDGTMAKGVQWEKANKGPGSRVIGWERLRLLLAQGKKEPCKPREKPGIFINRNCRHWLRTVPTLMRGERNMDDIQDSEDHIADETRYRIMSHARSNISGRVVGDF